MSKKIIPILPEAVRIIVQKTFQTYFKAFNRRKLIMSIKFPRIMELYFYSNKIVLWYCYDW